MTRPVSGRRRAPGPCQPRLTGHDPNPPGDSLWPRRFPPKLTLSHVELSRPHSRLRSAFLFQESGLVIVILVLGVLFTIFSGTVRLPAFQTAADGSRQRVFTMNSAGDRVPATIERNKFLNAQNLAQLAKDTSFIAIMAVGMAFVIISGGIDLSVGAIYALASVLGALVLHRYGPTGAMAATAPWLGILLGVGACLGVAVLCGLAERRADRRPARASVHHHARGPWPSCAASPS